VVEVELNATLLKDGEGTSRGSVASVRDITERKKTEKVLRLSEKKYHTLIEGAKDGIVSVNEEGIIVEFNKKAEEIFGYTREEVMGKSVTMLSPEEDRARERKALEKFKATKWLGIEGRTVEREGLRKDGQRIPLEATWSVVEIEGENLITAILRDITARKNAERELREAKEFLEKVIENSKDGIIITDEKGNILSVNTAMVEMSGFNKEGLVGEHASIFSSEDKEMRKMILEKTAEMFEKGFSSYEAVQKRKDGTLINVACISSMIKNENGEYVAGVSIIRDVTERKRME
jgi:PAS domain S-box-containing protein